MTDTATPQEANDLLKNLRKELRAARYERDEYKDAYFQVEAILQGSTLYQGVNERWKDKRPILGIKLAKELMGKPRRPAWNRPPIGLPEKLVPERDYYLELVEWMGAGLFRAVKKGPDGFWHIRDEARNAELSGASLNNLLHSTAWDTFRSRK